MKTIKQKYIIAAPLKKVWQAFIDPKIINSWGAGPAKMSDNVGFKFSLWGGDVYGKNLEVIKNKKLVQDWYGGDWSEASKVTFIFKKEKDGTRVDLVHENVPDKEYKSISQGWKDYYLGPLKEFLEKT